MAWDVRIENRYDRLRRELRVWLVRESTGGYQVLDHSGVVHQLQPEVEAEPEWAWRIPADAAAALFAELGRHLGAVESPVALRKDYDAERQRVDRLMDHLLMRTMPV